MAMKLTRILLVLALATSIPAWGEPTDAPARIARLGYVEGQLSFNAAHETASTALPDRPLIPGDRLVTEAGRAELALGTATVRLDEHTELSMDTINESTVRVELSRGTVSVHVRELFESESFAIATPNTTLTLRLPGEYRIAVTDDSITDVTVRGGSAEAITAGGPVRVAEGQRVRFEGRQALASLVTPRANDAFDEWVLEREVVLADLQPLNTPIISGDEYRELDQYGEWNDDPNYGRVWMPSYAYGGYDPFRHGYWQTYGMSRTWVHSLPWAYYTFNSGRWAYLDHLNRWCWVPRRHEPVGEPVAGNPRPIGQPGNDGRPDSGDNDGSPSISPRRLGADRASAGRDVASMKPSRRDNPAPPINRDPPAPERNASAPPRETPTMRPSRPAESRREAPSSPARATSREDSTIRTQ